MHVGIDLGTTFSLIARVDQHGKAILCSDMHESQRFKTPSVVHISEEGAVVGHIVEELLDDTPTLPHVRFVKLRMGQKEPVLSDHWDRHWRAEAISALIVKKLCRDAKAQVEEEIESALVSVPGNFSDVQRRATLRAGLLAGLDGVDLVDEPLAAAAHYGASRGAPQSTILVYDLGGGTFDATVLRVEADGLSALATDGVPELGGKTFDDVIMAQIAQQFRASHRYDPLEDDVASTRLRKHAEAIKIKLSAPGTTQIRTPLMLGGRVQEIVITRRQLESWLAPHIDLSLAICERTLAAAGSEGDANPD